MSVIEVEELAKVYRAGKGDPVRALDGVSFSVPAGQIFGLLGPNGAGKSTLIKCLTTITAPTSGRAVVGGFDVVRRPLDVRRQIAVVLQQAAVETMLSVEDNLLVYAYLHGIGRREARSRLRAIVEEFDLGDLLAETVQDLSIGTKRRVQVAKIFMVDAPVVFLDEATTGMDPLMKRRVMERIRAEARAGRTVLITTQILSEAEQLCDTIMIIDHGRKLAAGTLPELRRLAEQLFRVSLTFAEMNDELAARLAGLEAVEMTIDGRQVELVFRGEEAALLERLADIARLAPITGFEVRGADLEQVFVALVEEKR
ncbi:MAG TPA: ABC transporter ATP-binding protein [Thermoanaerobaculia bacterium]|nr:ABC transporter ATP-binding protein [Thermoanaerobaculia bacterium]